MLQEHIDRYLVELDRALAQLDRQAVWIVVKELMNAWREQRQIFLFGNGGSAALASHMANDLCRIIVPGQPRLRALALTDNMPLLTAIANDTTYENIFAEQLRNYCRPGDVVIAISCSGQSLNVLAGLQAARELGARTIGFTGNTGGQLKDWVDICVLAPAEEIWQQEDIHLVLDHVISGTLRSWISTVAEYAARPARALILAAGEGTRLRPLTLERPKPMLPINGKPLLAHTLEWLRQQEIDHIAINLHHCPDQIVNTFGDGSLLGVHITYSYEDPIMGTAGAVRKLNGFLGDHPVVVVYGDVLTNLNLNSLLAFHRQAIARDPSTGVTLSLYHVANPTEVGLVELGQNNRVTRFVEKPRAAEVFTDLANAGVLIIEPDVIDHIPPNTFYDFGQHLFPRLLASGVAIYGWVVPHKTYVLDIGTPERYAQAQYEWPAQLPVLDTI